MTMETFYELDGPQDVAVERARQAVRSVVERESAAVDREGRFPRASIDALADAGVLGLTVPKKWGGLEQGPRTFAAVAETIGRSCPSTGMVFVMHVCATNVIALNGSKRCQETLREIASGRHLTTLAFSEKGSRSHFWAPVSREVANGDAVSLSAEKSFVTSAGEAQSYVASTLAANAKTPVESTLYLVRRDAPGVKVPASFDGLGLRGNASAPVTMRDVRLTSDDRMGEAGKGFDIMMQVVLPWFQVGSAAISTGIAEAALAATAAHVNSARFDHLGAALNTLPNLRANVAQMRIEIDRSRSQLAYTIRAMEKPGPHTLPAVLASKAQAAEMAIAVTDLAMRTCGGAAFTKTMPVERFFRDARASAVMAPTTDVLKDFLGKAVLGLPLF
jgi:alkylation response protein AidB-like acyl-CoA dehydrogenase